MRLLLTGDWQTSAANIEECEKALLELKAAIKKYKPDVLIHLGDFKEAYDPIPGIVTKFWIRAIRELTEMLRVYALLGNHDRLAQSLTADHWMDVLAAAGARVICGPMYLSSLKAFAIPYGTREQTLEWAAKRPKDAELLFYHCEVAGASGSHAVNAITPEEMQAHKYAACFGGHLHEHQQFARNMWYVGSPFCMDWGEANQTKGIVLCDYDGGIGDVRQLKTKIPHWYDFDYLQSTGHQPEAGSYVRVKVPISTRKVTDELHAVEKELLAQYGDVHIFAVPEIVRNTADDVLSSNFASDEEMLTQYIASTLPDAARFKPEHALAYMKKILPQRGAVGVAGLRFLQATGENVLCFDKIKLDYRKQGLVLLRGRNKAWPRRSNGSGKTSVLSLLTLAFSGRNNKDQKTDEWAAEFTDEPAVVRLWLQARGKLFKIERGRRPHKLIFTVDGKNRSTGIRGTGRDETQGRIERLLGFDLHMLQNSVYIDQTVANGFLFGTQKTRMDLVAKLCNLERYELALKAVKDEIGFYEERLQKLERNQDKARERFTMLRDQYQQLKKEHTSVVLAAYDDVQKQIADLVQEHAELVAHKDFYVDLQKDVDGWAHTSDELHERESTLQASIKALSMRRVAVKKLIDAGKCSQCGAATTGLQSHELLTIDETLTAQKKDYDTNHESLNTINKKMTDGQKKLEKYEDRLYCVERDLRNYRAEQQRMESAADSERERIAEQRRQRAQLKRRLEKLQQVFQRLRKKYREVSVRLEMLQYVKASFQRGGIPLALSHALCPVLNAAAEEYSSIFTDGKIKIRFTVQDGDFEAEVVNAAGSGNAKGQSVGEAAMAGTICAFALRDAAPRTNLLILDEPGHGLDAEGQKEFASGLLKIKDRYETMIVTTHSQIIESILGGETVWTVEKENRISRLKR